MAALELQEWIYNTLSSDTVITTTYGATIAPIGVDEPETFPCVIFQVVGESDSTQPPKGVIIMMQIGVYVLSGEDAVNDKLLCEQIFEQVHSDMKYVQANTPSPQKKVYWSIGTSTIDMSDAHRRMWSKIGRFKFWVIG